jgi:hypothetical protein
MRPRRVVNSPIRSMVPYDPLPIQNVPKYRRHKHLGIIPLQLSVQNVPKMVSKFCASGTTGNSISDYEPHHIKVCSSYPRPTMQWIRSHAPWRQQRRCIYLKQGILIGSCRQPPNNRPSRSGLSDGRMALNDDVGRRSANDADLRSTVRHPDQIQLNSALDFPVFWLSGINISPKTCVIFKMLS